ncbi:hypothetical protein SpCBS45565_g00598 [Spizellomyces sp. 'palustris']|nr:hypothetical protein SpCBS45565_g00598 [Spizellomyces sp. 'palustris']
MSSSPKSADSSSGAPSQGRKRSVSIGQKFLSRNWGQSGTEMGEGEPSELGNTGGRRASMSQGGKLSEFVRPKSTGLSASVPAETSSFLSDTEEDSTERRVRIARVMTKQQHRTSAHVQQFSKINVTVTGTDVSLEMTVDRDQTVEHLAKQIEAEYAYKFFLHEEDRSAAQKKGRDPLVIGQVYDAGMLALKFEDRIGDVLGYTETVSVINAFEGESINRNMSPVDVEVSDAECLELSGSRASDGNGTTSTAHLPPLVIPNLEDSINEASSVLSGQDPSASDKSLLIASAASLLSNVTTATDKSTTKIHPRSRQSSLYPTTSSLDDRLQSCLRNKLALRYFSEFCVEEYTIENLLFWLDVEIFQSCKPHARDTYSKYIYLTYIAPNAPLQVNISAEIRKDIQWPMPEGYVDETIFDEAQEQVYAMLKGHSFLRFEKSAKYKQYQEAKQADRTEFLRGRITGSFAAHFPTNAETARSIIPILESSPLVESPTMLGTLVGDKNNRNSKIMTIKFKESVLTKTLTQYFPLANRILEGYFNDANRSSWAEKQRRMHKEKKLAKFFGERPSVELIQKQIFAASDVYLAGLEDILAFGDSSDDLLRVRKSDELANAEDPTSMSHRRKKKDKLETFFGDKLTSQQKRVQQIVVPGQTTSILGSEPGETGTSDSTESANSEDEVAPVETTNELDPNERRILQRRTKKIASMLGESLDERTISQTVTFPAMQEKLFSSQNLSGLALGGDGNVPMPVTDNDGKSRFTSRDFSTRSTTNTVDSSMSEEADADSKYAHKRRLDKISSLMGQRIGVTEIQEAQATANLTPQPVRRPLTQEEKKQFQKKASKLERLLGQLPPTEALLSSLVPADKPEVTRVRRSLAGLSFILRQAKDAVDILDALTAIAEDKELPPPPPLPSTGLSKSPSAQSNISDVPAFLTPGISMELNKESRQKRLNKLRKFFGDNISVEILVESQILSDLERSIEEEVVDESELERLRRQVNDLREDLRRRSDQFRYELDQDDGGDYSEAANYLAVPKRNSVTQRVRDLVPRMSVERQSSVDVGPSKTHGTDKETVQGEQKV